MENDPKLALWFTPQCIRDHFDGEIDLSSVSAADLRKVGETALFDDAIYRAFHEALVFALKSELGIEAH